MTTSPVSVSEETLISSGKKRLLLLGWIALILAGYVLLFALLQREEKRDASRWEMRLGLIASTQARDVGNWLQDHQRSLQNLADNTSLKLYMTTLNNATTATTDTDLAQQTYLRNLIIASAREHGFYAADSTPNIGANLPQTASAGIALLGAQSQPLVATASMPDVASLPASIRQPAQPNAVIVSEPYLSANNMPSLAFRVPVYGVQDEAGSAAPLGFILGVTLLDERLFDLLKTLDATPSNEESALLYNYHNQFIYVSPLGTQIKPLSLTMDDTAQAVEVAAASQPRSFTRAINYKKSDSFAVSYPVKDTPWSIVRMVEYKTAMSDTHNRALWLSIAYALTAGLLTMAIVAVWRNATTLQARSVAQHFRSLAHRLERQEALLGLIAENTPISTFITDNHGYYRYANAMAATRAGTTIDGMLGKTLSAVLGKESAKSLLSGNEKATEQATPLSQHIMHYDDHGLIKEAIETVHIPLASIPVLDSEEEVSGLLVLEKDFTLAAQASEKSERTLQQLVSTLVTIVDRRDPNAANHSAMVALLSESIAKEMDVDTITMTTATTAGRLMNIGKILVPENILTAKDDNDEAHREHVRQALNASADLLDGIAFDGPVVETIRQSQGTKEEQTLLAARIVGLANDFVAIISPRAWRDGRPIEEAIKIALAGIDKEYDRAVVAALINYLDNHGGRITLEQQISAAS